MSMTGGNAYPLPLGWSDGEETTVFIVNILCSSSTLIAGGKNRTRRANGGNVDADQLSVWAGYTWIFVHCTPVASFARNAADVPGPNTE